MHLNWKLEAADLRLLDKLFNVSHLAVLTDDEVASVTKLHKVIVSLREASFI